MNRHYKIQGASRKIREAIDVIIAEHFHVLPHERQILYILRTIAPEGLHAFGVASRRFHILTRRYFKIKSYPIWAYKCKSERSKNFDWYFVVSGTEEEVLKHITNLRQLAQTMRVLDK